MQLWGELMPCQVVVPWSSVGAAQYLPRSLLVPNHLCAVPSLRVEWFAGGAKGISSAKNTNNLSTSQRAEFKSDFKKREAWQSARVVAYLAQIPEAKALARPLGKSAYWGEEGPQQR